MVGESDAGVELAGNVELGPGADQGFASMMAELVRQNLQDDASKRDDFQRLKGRVCMVVEDAEVTITLAFGGGNLRVDVGTVGTPDLTLRATSEWITQMSLMEWTSVRQLTQNSPTARRLSRLFATPLKTLWISMGPIPTDGMARRAVAPVVRVLKHVDHRWLQRRFPDWKGQTTREIAGATREGKLHSHFNRRGATMVLPLSRLLSVV